MIILIMMINIRLQLVKTYSIGNSIRICVAAADVLTKRIDFVFEKDGILAFKPVKQRKIRGKRK